MSCPPPSYLQDLGAYDKPLVGIIMGEHVTLLLWSLVPPDLGCDKWILTGRGYLWRDWVDLPFRHHTAHLSLTNTRVVGVPPLVIPLFGIPIHFGHCNTFPQEQPDGELGNKIFTINDNKFVKICSVGPEGT